MNFLVVVSNKNGGEMNRDWSISLIRLISLIMIISCHILQGLDLELAFWVNIGVQIFFFISGYLYGWKRRENLNIREWYKKQYVKLVRPLALLVIIMVIIDTTIFKIEYGITIIIANMIGLGGFYGTLKATSHTWFVSYILVCYLITPLLNKIKFEKMRIYDFVKQLLIIAIFLEILDFFKVTNINAAWIFNYIIGYYFAAYYINSHKDHKKFDRVILIISTLILIPRLILQYGNLNFSNFIVTNKSILMSWSHVLLGVSIFIILFNLFTKIKVKKCKVLELSDKFSYYIYLVHQIFILNHLSVLFFTNYLSINILLIFGLSIIFGVLLYYLNYVIGIICNKFKKSNTSITMNQE